MPQRGDRGATPVLAIICTRSAAAPDRTPGRVDARARARGSIIHSPRSRRSARVHPRPKAMSLQQEPARRRTDGQGFRRATGHFSRSVFARSASQRGPCLFLCGLIDFMARHDERGRSRSSGVGAERLQSRNLQQAASSIEYGVSRTTARQIHICLKDDADTGPLVSFATRAASPANWKASAYQSIHGNGHKRRATSRSVGRAGPVLS